MLDKSTRSAVLRLRELGYSARRIAQILSVSRHAVHGVLRGERAEESALEPCRETRGEEVDDAG